MGFSTLDTTSHQGFTNAAKHQTVRKLALLHILKAMFESKKMKNDVN